MTRLINIIRNYRIREVADLQVLIFWVTLVTASVVMFCMIAVL